MAEYSPRFPAQLFSFHSYFFAQFVQSSINILETSAFPEHFTPSLQQSRALFVQYRFLCHQGGDDSTNPVTRIRSRKNLRRCAKQKA